MAKLPPAKQDFTATIRLDVDEVFRLTQDRDLSEIGILFIEGFNAAMAQVKRQMETRGYSPEKGQSPHLAVSFTSTGLPND